MARTKRTDQRRRKGPSKKRLTSEERAEIVRTAVESRRKVYPPFKPWHRPTGLAMLVVGILVAVVNDLAYLNIEVMPGGHNELYLMLGVLVAGAGAYFAGFFSPDS
ncbi:MAG: hypothetical protein ACLGHL_07380 [Actinomycetota bacterium]